MALASKRTAEQQAALAKEVRLSEERERKRRIEEDRRQQERSRSVTARSLTWSVLIRWLQAGASSSGTEAHGRSCARSQAGSRAAGSDGAVRQLKVDRDLPARPRPSFSCVFKVPKVCKAPNVIFQQARRPRGRPGRSAEARTGSEAREGESEAVRRRRRRRGRTRAQDGKPSSCSPTACYQRMVIARSRFRQGDANRLCWPDSYLRPGTHCRLFCRRTTDPPQHKSS